MKNSGASLLFGLKKHRSLVVILLLLVAVAAMYGWKVIAVTNAKNMVRTKAEKALTQQNLATLRLAALPLAWAVRSEMIRGNLEQINQYFITYVHEPNVKQVILAKPDGTILLATNKRLEGKSVTEFFPSSALNVQESTVLPMASGILTASPVMGLNTKLAVLLVLHLPPNYALE